jgi:transcriptional regulator GlxA family with amidase domain
MAGQVPTVREPRRVVFLLLPRVHVLDLSGPAQAFAEAATLGGAYRIRHCAAVPEITTAQGLTFGRIEPLPAPGGVDRVIVPGVDSASLGRLEVPVGWLRAAYDAGAEICSVCSGAFALAEAGLLDGRNCTTHWMATERLQRERPRARVHSNVLYVRDGRIVTSAGVASGIDMALSLIEEDHGPLVASRVAQVMVVWLRRDGSREQISAYLDHRTHLNPGVHRVQDWIVAHPEARPSLAELASIAGVSPRHLTRMFRNATGISPKGFMNRIKLEVAASLLHAPQLTLERIAEQCGFRDPRQLRRLWKRSYGVPLSRSRREPILSRNAS